MRKDPSDPSTSTPDSESGRKKKYSAPHFTRLTPDEAKAMLTATALPASPVVRELLEWIAEPEKRPTKASSRLRTAAAQTSRAEVLPGRLRLAILRGTARR